MQPQQNKQQQSGTNIVIQGRVVWGSMKKSKKKVFGTQTDYIDPKTGQTVDQWAFGLAVPKPTPQSSQGEVENFQKLWQALCAEGAKAGFPNPGHGNFAWKFDDGDGVKDNNQPYPQHFKGCLVIACKTLFPLKLMAWEGNTIVQVTDDQIKCGDYCQVALNISAHDAPNAGLYINPSFVARFGFGEAIVNTPDPATIFGATPPPMPQGASHSPVGTAPGNPGFGAPTGAPQFAQQFQQGGQPTMAPQAGPSYGGQPGFGNAPSPQLQHGGTNYPGPNPQGTQYQQGGGVPGQQPGFAPNYGPLPGQFQPQGAQPPMGGGSPQGFQQPGFQQQSPGQVAPNGMNPATAAGQQPNAMGHQFNGGWPQQ